MEEKNASVLIVSALDEVACEFLVVIILFKLFVFELVPLFGSFKVLDNVFLLNMKYSGSDFSHISSNVHHYHSVTVSYSPFLNYIYLSLNFHV